MACQAICDQHTYRWPASEVGQKIQEYILFDADTHLQLRILAASDTIKPPAKQSSGQVICITLSVAINPGLEKNGFLEKKFLGFQVFRFSGFF